MQPTTFLFTIRLCAAAAVKIDETEIHSVSYIFYNYYIFVAQILRQFINKRIIKINFIHKEIKHSYLISLSHKTYLEV